MSLILPNTTCYQYVMQHIVPLGLRSMNCYVTLYFAALHFKHMFCLFSLWLSVYFKSCNLSCNNLLLPAAKALALLLSGLPLLLLLFPLLLLPLHKNHQYKGRGNPGQVSSALSSLSHTLPSSLLSHPPSLLPTSSLGSSGRPSS